MKHGRMTAFVVAAIFAASAFSFISGGNHAAPLAVQHIDYGTEIAKVKSASSTNSPALPLALITEPDDGYGRIVSEIQAAEKSVHLVIYQLQDARVEESLAEANDKGVDVKVILDDSSFFGRHANDEAYAYLTGRGVAVKRAPKYLPITHQKTLIIDKERAIIATFNLVTKYYPTGREFALIDNDSADVKAIEEVFDADWNREIVSPSAGSDLVWSPGSSEAMLNLINGAERTLEIYNEEMADPRITAALADAAKRNVDTKLVMTYATEWKAALSDLAEAGVKIKTYPGGGKGKYIHAKAIVADQKIAFVGSENFSAQSLDYNRELGILISQSDIIASLEKTFSADWLGGRSYAQP